MDNLRNTTREDKIRLINSLQKNFHHKNELLLPDTELYPDSFDQDSLTRAGKKICVWLGIKPHSLRFEINDNLLMGYYKKNDGDLVTIDSRLSAETFVASAVVAKACLEYFLVRKKIDHNPEIIELALVEFGLGLLILNSFNSSNSLSGKLKRNFAYSKHPEVNDYILSHFSPQEYARLVNNYISHNQLDYRSVFEHMLPWSIAYLDLRGKSIAKQRPENYSKKAKKDLNTVRVKTTLLAFLTISVLGFGIFLWQKQPKRLPVILQRQKEDIEVLEKSYKNCMDSAKQKQDQYNSDDIFLARDLDAHVLRCTSIRNTHDYMVRQYNQELAKAGF